MDFQIQTTAISSTRPVHILQVPIVPYQIQIGIIIYKTKTCNLFGCILQHNYIESFAFNISRPIFDPNHRINPYVSFADYYRNVADYVEKAKTNGTLADFIDFD